MKIGIAGPMSLKLLDFKYDDESKIPVGYSFPLISMQINALIEMGHEVVAVTTSTGIKEPMVFYGPNLTLAIAPRRERHAARDFFSRERAFLKELMLKYPTDIMHAQWTYEFAWAALDTGLPTLITMHDHARTILRFMPDPYRFMRYLMNSVVFRRAEHMACVSTYLYDLLPEKYQKKNKVIPLFYPRFFDRFPIAAEKEPFLLSVSHGFGRRKNIDTALHAFPMIRRAFPNIEYYLIGEDMEAGGAAHRYAQKHGLTEGVRFLGKTPYEQTLEKIRHARIFLHPSREEAGATAVVEAMILGAPVVGGNRSGCVPYHLDEGRGVVCDINSPAAIAEHVIKLLTDDGMCRYIIERAHIHAKTYFNEQHIVNMYLDYYREILNGKSDDQKN